MALLLNAPTAAVRRTGRWLFLLSLCVYTFTAGGSLTTTDAVVAYDLTQSLVERRSLALSGNLLGMDAHRGADGRYYSPFGIAQSIYNVPFYVAGQIALDLAPAPLGKPDSVPKAVVALGQTLVVAGIVWQLFRLAALLTTPQTALFASLTCAFASLFWPYSSFGFNQPLAAFALLAAVRAAVTGVRQGIGRQLTIAGLWIAAGLLTRHELALAVIPIGLWIALDGNVAWRSRVRRVLAFAPGVAAGVAGWLAYNALRFGNPLDSGFLRDSVPGFGSPILDGMAGLLLSPSTSIFIYSPFAACGVVGIVALARRDRSIACLFAALCVGALLFYSTLGNWIGGRSYGSRYLLVVLPYLGLGWAVLLEDVRGRTRLWLFLAVTGAGLIVQMPGVLMDYAKVGQETAIRDGAATTEARQWTWRAAPLLMNAAALVSAVPDNMAYVTGVRPRPAIPPGAAHDRSFSQQFAFSLDLWWLYLFYLGALSRFGIAMVVLVFTAAIVVCARGLERSARTMAG